MNNEIRLIAEALHSAQVTIAQNQSIVTSAQAFLESKIRPICLAVIREFNDNSVCKIRNQFTIVFSAEFVFSLKVQIVDRQGRELDGDFMDLDEPETLYGSELRPIFERELDKAGLPFAFGEIDVPSHYFCK